MIKNWRSSNFLKVLIAVAIFAAAYSDWTGPPRSYAGLTQESKNHIIKEMNEFCAGLYNGNICTSTKMFGKRNWVISKNFEIADAPYLDQADAVLRKNGWVRHDRARRIEYCKLGYVAQLELYDENGRIRIAAFAYSENCK